MSEESTSVVAVAIEAAQRAGAAIMEGVTRPLEVAYKGPGEAANDPVTDVDKRSEALIAATIREHFPHHRLLSEEGTTGGDDLHWRWIVDPLDGTINYAHRLPLSCVSIAAEHDGVVVAGVVFNPLAGELFVAERGHGATLNGTPIHVSETEELRRAVLSSAMGYWQAAGRRFNRNGALGAHVQALRDLGSAALELCYVAAGRLDGMAGSTLNPWDVAAGALMVREAGGQVTDPYGDPFKTEGKHLVVSNGRLHGAILARLHESSEPAGSMPDAPNSPAGRPRLRLALGTGSGERTRALVLAVPIITEKPRR